MNKYKIAEYCQRGESLNYKNTGTEIIPAGAVVALGKRIGVAGMEIKPGEVGSLHVTGVFEISKKIGEALTAGDCVAFTDTDGITKSAGSLAGFVVEDAATDAVTARVKITG